jgi:hypothetical protein
MLEGLIGLWEARPTNVISWKMRLEPKMIPKSMAGEFCARTRLDYGGVGVLLYAAGVVRRPEQCDAIRL